MRLFKSPYSPPRLLGVITVCAIVFTGGLAHAAACRGISTVTASAAADQNTSKGGHLTQHILGLTPPSNKSQNGETLFKSDTDWDTAWNGYTSTTQITPVDCSDTSNAPRQQVSLAKLGITTTMTGATCSAAGNDGKCTSSTDFTIGSIVFAFVRNSSNEWIINSAYPRQ
ncbi:hypothetical protein [Thalassospira alkalitolerans]|uniref:hypothetical protein n=1 Tax=Thalassospira alkalitolerans TaxID=1293890 RepID=UPI0030EE96FF|tara:strand:+ start:7767 stop:8276 length:510 start_codon:yes stop_codon:yes gene_type:complete